MYKHSPSQSLSGSCSINCGTSVVHALSVSLVTSPCLQHAFWFHIYLFLLLHSPYFTCLTPISCSFQSQVSWLSASNPYFRGIFLFMNLPICFSLEFHSWLVVFPHRVIPWSKAAEDWLGHGYFWRPVPAELWADADWKMENAAGNVAWREYFMAKNGKPGRNDWNDGSKMFSGVLNCFNAYLTRKKLDLKVSIFGHWSNEASPWGPTITIIVGSAATIHPQVVEILSRKRSQRRTIPPCFDGGIFFCLLNNTFKEPKRPFIKQFFETGIDFCCISWVLFWHWSKWTAGGTAGFWHFGGWFSSLAKCQSPCSGLRPPAETLWCRCSWWLWSFHL